MRQLNHFISYVKQLHLNVCLIKKFEYNTEKTVEKKYLPIVNIILAYIQSKSCQLKKKCCIICILHNVLYQSDRKNTFSNFDILSLKHIIEIELFRNDRHQGVQVHYGVRKAGRGHNKFIRFSADLAYIYKLRTTLIYIIFRINYIRWK